jgi:hypothetical protein
MNSKIIIIEKDLRLADAITCLLEQLNFEPVHYSNWSYKIKTHPKQRVAAMIINIEILTITQQELQKSLSSQPGPANKKIPLLFIYKKLESSAYKKFSSLPHAAELKMPFNMEDLYSVLRSIVQIEPIKGGVINLEEGMYDIMDFNSKFSEWLTQLSKLIALK